MTLLADVVICSSRPWPISVGQWFESIPFWKFKCDYIANGVLTTADDLQSRPVNGVERETECILTGRVAVQCAAVELRLLTADGSHSPLATPSERATACIPSAHEAAKGAVAGCWLFTGFVWKAVSNRIQSRSVHAGITIYIGMDLWIRVAPQFTICWCLRFHFLLSCSKIV